MEITQFHIYLLKINPLHMYSIKFMLHRSNSMNCKWVSIEETILGIEMNIYVKKVDE